MKEIKHLDNVDGVVELTNSWEERGIKRGKEVATRELALELLKEGSSVEFVAKITRLGKEEIEELGKSL